MNLHIIFSTNYKDIEALMLSFALVAGFLGLILNLELVTPGNGIFESNFQLYNSILIDDSFCLNMISFNSLIQKVKPKILYLGGSVLANQFYNKYYSFRPLGIGNANWDPNNYSIETQEVIEKFRLCLLNKNKNDAYDIMYAVLGNKDGIFSKSYGKVTSVINSMVFFYNRDNVKNKISEEEFLKTYGYIYSDFDLSFLNETNRGTIMSNINEILAPKIVMRKKDNIIVERSQEMQEKINLSFQKNPEYTIGIFKNKSNSDSLLIIYDSDLKITDQNSLSKKLQDLSIVSYDKTEFGMNIVVVASFDKQDSEIIFSSDQIHILVSEIKKLYKKYPSHFYDFDENSNEFLEFKKTGLANILNKSDLPLVRYYRPIEFYNLPHFTKKFENSKIYLDIISKNNKRDFVKEKTNITEILNDDID